MLFIKNGNQDIPRLDKKDVAKSILVVEDDQDTKKLIVHILEKQRYRIIPSADGIEALLHLGKESFDLILSDINMPNLDGFKLTEIIKQKDINVPVIFLTSRTSQEDEIKGLSIGAVDYIK